MSNNKIQFKIVTPERSVYEAEVEQATLPVADGEVTILPNHRAYIAALKPGEIVIKKNEADVHLAISGGFIEFANNTLTVLADTAEQAEEIDIKRAEEARGRAEELKKQKVSMSEFEYARVAAAVEKEMVRLKVARRGHGAHQINLN
jgi:F-type H+-transporting ATPase subunit epsilon